MSRMKWDKVDRLDWVLISIYWLFALPFYIYSYYGYELTFSEGGIDLMVNLIVDTCNVFFITHFLFPNFFLTRRYLTFMWLLLFSFLITAIFYHYAESLYFDNRFEHPTLWRIFNRVLDQAQLIGFITTTLIGKKLFESQRQILQLEKEKKENELQMLRSQIDPHFLFNSLNILDVLMVKNTEQARSFLKHLSALYRYLLRHKDEDVVLLSDELEFTNSYIYLLKQRFGNAFIFEYQNTLDDETAYFIPPGAIQTLIENAIKHNEGNVKDPIKIGIKIDGDKIEICNTIRSKPQKPEGTRTGLRNLEARYRLLTDRPVQVIQNSRFEVKLPLIKAVE